MTLLRLEDRLARRTVDGTLEERKALLDLVRRGELEREPLNEVAESKPARFGATSDCGRIMEVVQVPRRAERLLPAFRRDATISRPLATTTRSKPCRWRPTADESGVKSANVNQRPQGDTHITDTAAHVVIPLAFVA